MASKFLTLSIAFALLAGITLALPVNNEATTEPAKTSAESSPEGTQFNYEVPTEEELNPAALDDEEKLLQELQPPAIDSYVPFNVEAIAAAEEKPRKGGKKYNKEEKWINKNPAVAKDVASVEDEDRQYALLDFIIENLFQGIADQYNAQRRDLNADDGQVLVLNKGEYIPSPQRRNDEEAEGERILFQIQGHQGGAESYKFGFDTGKKEDRQFRVEERDNDGTVRGQYGYVDKRGREHVMSYTSSAEEGFRVVRDS